MAEMVISPLLEVIFDKLAAPIMQMLGDRWDVTENVQKLRNTLPMVQAVLEDAEEQQLTNKAVRIWLSNFKDAVRDVEDLLDRLAAEGPAKNWFILTSAERARKMFQNLETIAMDGLKLSLREGGKVDRQSDRRETSSFVVKSEVHGRDKDKDEIVNQLLCCEGNVSYIVIIGMGGLGKTTLAQLAYNDERVTQHFDVKMWVFVSEDFNAKKIMKTLIESATGDKCEFTEMDVLQSKLWRLLHTKRYLIVLDDVWTEDQDEWDKLRPVFGGGVDGSKIIVTTRSEKVGLLMDTPNFPYYLKGLPEDDCWNLFKQRAFRQGEEDKYPNLLPIGKQIVQKCGGVPLAVRTLGSLMRLKREEREWLTVQKSEIWNLDAYQRGILPALRLSYFHLPSHLKHCFAFCSIFPKGYEIKKDKLIQLWMAGGLIQSGGGTKLPEDIGIEYFNDLLWMSFFQVLEQCENGSVTGCTMHDLIRDLAKSVVGNESITLELGLSSSSLRRTRHSSVVCDFRSSRIPEDLYGAKHLRTLLLFSGGNTIEATKKIFSRFIYLQSLDLSASGIERLDGSIGGLLCLRYLDLSYTHIDSLSNYMEKLPCLQTLNVIGCYRLRHLPDLARMISLRHLNNIGCEALNNIRCEALNQIQLAYPILKNSYLPKPSNQIQTLPMIVVGGLFEIELLGRLNHLRGELTMKHLEKLSHADDTKIANLTKKANLESLGLYWGNCDDRPKLNPGIPLGITDSDLMCIRRRHIRRVVFGSSGPSRRFKPDATVGEEVIKGLKPHQNLKKLFIKGYPGVRFPLWTLPNLILVELTNWKNCECLPVLGNLLLLKTLSLHGMHAVKCIGNDFYGEGNEKPFPSLEELVLSDFPNLEEWFGAENRDSFSGLVKVIVNKCPKLTAMPLFSSLRHLELRDCRATLFNYIEGLSTLTTLVIEKVAELSSLPEGFLSNNPLLSSLKITSCPMLRSLPSELGNLTALKSLTIRWCEALSSLPQGMQNLTALESLEIGDCNSIISMTEAGIGGLSSLRTLSIENCRELISLSPTLQDLTSLEQLTIMFCPSLGSLPEGAQHLTALRSLTILSCPLLLSLPEGLQYVTALHCLEIRSCPGLTALPEWVGNLTSLRSLTISDSHNLRQLPGGLKLLTALQHLSIQDCPELEGRCTQGSGEDWQKIAHVPHKYIGSPVVGQSSTAGSSSC